MIQFNRLKSGGRIDRNKVLNFTFDGRHYQGYQGDTLASALLANGVNVLARSFKYGRPRGIFGSGAEEPNAIVQLGSGAETVPNLRATQVELYEGLDAFSVDGWPSVENDWLGGFKRMGSALTPPGFYYKTLMWPRQLWMSYEHFIRKAAGLGRAPVEADPDIYDKVNQHCEVLVIGAGPAGVQAALHAGRTGARVIIADEQAEMGGYLLSTSAQISDGRAQQWLADVLAELASMTNVQLLPRSTVFGYYDQNFLTVVERRTDHQGLTAEGTARQRMHRVRAKRVVLASGAIERPPVFANNDLPGVLLASAVENYIQRYAVAPGQRLVLFTSNDQGYEAALHWHAAGRKVQAIVDSRSSVTSAVSKRVKDAGIELISGHGVIEAKGSKRVRAVLIAALSSDGRTVLGKTRKIHCDTLAVAAGWSPAVHLSSHTGSKPVWNSEISGFVPGDTVQKLVSAGAVTGQYTLQACLQAGAEAGVAAASAAGMKAVDTNVPSVSEDEQQAPRELFLMPHTKKVSRAPAQFVDFQLDVTASAIHLAAREGYDSIEHTKRYTALGFGTDQGKLGNINGMAILADASKRSIEETGTTIFRPSYTPTTFGAIAGRDVGELFDPERYTAMHRWHIEQGAEFENVGQWKRPWFFPRGNEDMDACVQRECLAVRNSLGILDASTLGKIDIQGTDAAEFINRIYTNAWLKLAPGKCRYGLMLKEDGMIFDDGVTACIAENRYLMFTTTGGAAGVLNWLELWHQTEWPELKVYFTSVTDHWTTATLSGPNARKVLAKVCDDIDLSAEAFQFMDWREGTVAGVKARVFRISFTGELSYEVNVPAHYGMHVWQKLIEAGEEFDITPYGTETMHVLRAEKGFIIVGQDTDGSRTPGDMNMNWIVNNKKGFSYLGQRSLLREDTKRTDRKQLVGLKPVNSSEVIPEGSQIVADPNQEYPMKMQGHVTSSYFSPSLGHSFALAVLENGLQRTGETIYCPQANGQVMAAEVVDSVFYDPKGERQHV